MIQKQEGKLLEQISKRKYHQRLSFSFFLKHLTTSRCIFFSSPPLSRQSSTCLQKKIRVQVRFTGSLIIFKHGSKELLYFLLQQFVLQWQQLTITRKRSNSSSFRRLQRTRRKSLLSGMALKPLYILLRWFAVIQSRSKKESTSPAMASS